MEFGILLEGKNVHVKVSVLMMIRDILMEPVIDCAVESPHLSIKMWIIRGCKQIFYSNDSTDVLKEPSCKFISIF